MVFGWYDLDMTNAEKIEINHESEEIPPWNMHKIEQMAGSYFIDALTSPRYRKTNSPKVSGDYHELAKQGDKLLSRIIVKWRKEQGNGKATREKIGDLNFVSAKELCPVAIELEIDKVLRMTRPERAQYHKIDVDRKAHKKFITEPLEALVAAINLYSGYEAAEQFVRDTIIVIILRIRNHQ